MVIKKISFLLLFIFLAGFVSAQESGNGYVRLVLNEKQGSFSLFYLSNLRGRNYEPLLYADDPSTSFITVIADNVAYKPSQSNLFHRRIETPHGQPSLVYESHFMLIRHIFTPVKTPNSNNVNGVQITTIIHNKRSTMSLIGLRILLDTVLGEERGRIPFITNNQTIRNETVIEGNSDELYWISRGRSNALMGSIANPADPSARRPDYLHFANWKRLQDTNWNLEYRSGRSFTYRPYSVNDSAVAYYYLPVSVPPGESITTSIILTTDDPEWYENIPAVRRGPPPVQETPPAQTPTPAVVPEMQVIPEAPPAPVEVPAPVETPVEAPASVETPAVAPEIKVTLIPIPILVPTPPLAEQTPVPVQPIQEPEIVSESIFKPEDTSPDLKGNLIQQQPQQTAAVIPEPEPVVQPVPECEPEIKPVLSNVPDPKSMIVRETVVQPVPEPELVFEPEQIVIISEPEPEPMPQYPHLNLAQLRELYLLQDTLNKFIAGEIHLTEADLSQIERTINRLKNGH